MTTALLDTSVVIDLTDLRTSGADRLPDRLLVSALTLAEVVKAPLFAKNDDDRRRRERLVLDTMSAFPDPLPFDASCVAAYRSVAAQTVSAGRTTRRRSIDLLIAATAHAHGLPLITRNSKDVDHLGDLLEIRVL